MSTHDDAPEDEIRHLSKKELIREQRKAAYKKASAKAKVMRAERKAREKDPSTKEFQIKQAQKERARKIRKEAYDAAKSRKKEREKNIRAATKDDQTSYRGEVRQERDAELMASLRPASQLKPQLRLVKGGQQDEDVCE